MGMLIYGAKVFENADVVAYSFDWPDEPMTGTVVTAKNDRMRFLSVPGSPYDEIADHIVYKAHREASRSGEWPTQVVFAS